jgi:hypothetical protein
MPVWLRDFFRFLLCIAFLVVVELGVTWGTMKLAAAWYVHRYNIPDGEDLSNDMGLGMVVTFAALPALCVALPFSLWGSIRLARKILPEA